VAKRGRTSKTSQVKSSSASVPGLHICIASISASSLGQASPSQTLPHKLPLRKTHPELIWHRTPALIKPPHQPSHQLLPHLTQIPPQHLRILPIAWPLISLVQRKPRLPRQTKLLERQIYQALLRALGVLRWFQRGQTVGEEEDAVD